MNSVSMYAPDGTLGDVSPENVEALLKQGYKRVAPNAADVPDPSKTGFTVSALNHFVQGHPELQGVPIEERLQLAADLAKLASRHPFAARIIQNGFAALQPTQAAQKPPLLSDLGTGPGVTHSWTPAEGLRRIR